MHPGPGMQQALTIPAFVQATLEVKPKDAPQLADTWIGSGCYPCVLRESRKLPKKCVVGCVEEVGEMAS